MYIRVDEAHLSLVEPPTSLNYGEVLLFALIEGSPKRKDCFMSNSTLAKVLHTSERTIERWIQNLRNKNLIVDYYDGRQRYLKTVNFVRDNRQN